MSTDSATVHAADRVPPGHDQTPDQSDSQNRDAAGTPGTSPRASDTERADAVARLQAALGAGRLDLAETDERVAAAYAARRRHELAALLTDLPHDDVAFTDAPSWTMLWTLLVLRARATVTGAVGPRPTRAQHRTAAVMTALAVVWVVVCAVVGALAVGA